MALTGASDSYFPLKGKQQQTEQMKSIFTPVLFVPLWQQRSIFSWATAIKQAKLKKINNNNQFIKQETTKSKNNKHKTAAAVVGGLNKQGTVSGKFFFIFCLFFFIYLSFFLLFLKRLVRWVRGGGVKAACSDSAVTTAAASKPESRCRYLGRAAFNAAGEKEKRNKNKKK